jgi:hypothetical protein
VFFDVGNVVTLFGVQLYFLVFELLVKFRRDTSDKYLEVSIFIRESVFAPYTGWWSENKARVATRTQGWCGNKIVKQGWKHEVRAC